MGSLRRPNYRNEFSNAYSGARSVHRFLEAVKVVVRDNQFVHMKNHQDGPSPAHVAREMKGKGTYVSGNP